MVLTTPSACSNTSRDAQAQRHLYRIWLAIRNYSANEGVLPQQNGASWRHAKSTGIRNVPWRGLVLEDIAAIGSRSGAPPVAEQIEQVARSTFYFQTDLIQSNLGEAEHFKRIDEAPPFMVLAYTFPEKRIWNASEEREVQLLIENTTFGQKPGYLLFCNGSVAKFTTIKPDIAKILFTPAGAKDLSHNKLQKMNIVILPRR